MRRACVIGGLAAVTLVGCEGAGSDGYEASLRYPARRDPVVVRLPPSEPTGYPPPGRLDESIRRLPDLGGELVSPADLPVDELAALARTLEELLGTPASPEVPPSKADGGFRFLTGKLVAGSRLYAQKCASCHGFTGDGRGPVGPLTVPYPRDFRSGVFKVAVGDRKPTAIQLAGLLRRGVPGSAMPLYDMLPEEDIQALLAYMVHLSIRGEAEAAGLRAAADGDDPATAARAKATTAMSQWITWPSDPPTVTTPVYGDPGHADAVRRGKELFHSQTAGCATCHKDYGRAETYRYDVWGAPNRVPDLTRGEFRWGRDDATLAARVRHGIPAAGMPANPHLTDEQLRDLVTFVRDLGAPARLPADVRADVYPQAAGR